MARRRLSRTKAKGSGKGKNDKEKGKESEEDIIRESDGEDGGD